MPNPENPDVAGLPNADPKVDPVPKVLVPKDGAELPKVDVLAPKPVPKVPVPNVLVPNPAKIAILYYRN